jgi:membrane-bound ClpP family serine protease
VFNRMMLEPPPPEERITLSHREALADYSHLVGRAGEAVTDLRPGGRAIVDDELIDVIAQGEPLDRGARIVVVSAHANRVVVRKAT